MNVYVDADGDIWLEHKPGFLSPVTDGGRIQDPYFQDATEELALVDAHWGPLTKLVREP